METNSAHTYSDSTPNSVSSGHEPSFRSKAPRPSSTFAAVSWILVGLWAGFIFFMSSNTGDGLNEGLGIFSVIYQAMKDVQANILGPDVDVLSSIAHFCEYTLFGILLTNALRCHMPLRRAVIAAFILASLYGVTDEFHQLFVADRMCDPLDWLVDTAGGCLGAAIAWLALRARNCETKRRGLGN